VTEGGEAMRFPDWLISVFIRLQTATKKNGLY